jgi:hypothetical protein
LEAIHELGLKFLDKLAHAFEMFLFMATLLLQGMLVAGEMLSGFFGKQL